MTNDTKVIRSKRKTLALQINEHGELVIRAPYLMPRTMINAFIKQKASWIEKKQIIAQRKKSEITQRNFVDGDELLFMGETYQLRRVSSAQLSSRVSFDLQDTFLLKTSVKAPVKIIETWYKKEAKALFSDRATYYADQGSIRFKSMRLSSAHKRWGSCSSKKNININWKLIMAPLNVIDYVIVHELVHIKHMNHSKKFWSAVESLCPQYKKHRTWLKDRGHTLTI